jgi:replicative DNA helicase
MTVSVPDPYDFDPRWERALTFVACSRPLFWGRVAHAVDPDQLGDASAKLAFEAAALLFREVGRGPEKPLQVIERARVMYVDGKTTHEAVVALSDYFDAAEDYGLLSEEALSNELVPRLKKRLRKAAVHVAAEDVRHDRDLSKTTALIEKADRLGEVDESRGLQLNAASVRRAVEALQNLEYLPLGVTELDLKLDGGLRRGCLGIVLGASGAGKSMMLGHIAAEALRSGLFVAYATLELEELDVTARVAANLTGIPTRAIIRSYDMIENQFQAALAATKYGTWEAHHFAPLITTFPDIVAWVEDLERREGRCIDLLVTDYGDKLGAPKQASKGEKESSYGTGRAVFEAMRYYAVNHKGGRIWHWTACQATRGKDSKKKHLRQDDVADSMHKVRVADVVVSIDRDEETKSLEFGVLKNRHGEDGERAGPLPTDFALGRIAPIQDAGMVGPDRAYASNAATMLKKAPPL